MVSYMYGRIDSDHPLPGLDTDEPELRLPDDELPLLPEEEGEYVLVSFEEEEELLRGNNVCLVRLSELLLLLLYR